MKHKNAAMIFSLAENVELVVFYKVDGVWRETEFGTPVTCANEHFLCLPQHKEACLHWLNGGEVQGEDPSKPFSFDDYAPHADRRHWSYTSWYMRKDRIIRIKPKKEKRWLSIRRADLLVDDKPYKTREEAEAANSPAYCNHYELLIEV